MADQPKRGRPRIYATPEESYEAQKKRAAQRRKENPQKFRDAQNKANAKHRAMLSEAKKILAEREAVSPILS